MSAPSFDLQSHSIHSDGALPPREVVAAAAEAGVELLALSDHDTVDGVQEASAAAAELGIRNVAAVEISAVEREHGDLHVLGYGIDHTHAGLRDALAHYRGDRERRAARMIEALRELGFEVDLELLRARAAEGKSIGRPHLAQAVVAHPANAARLTADGLREPSAFLVAYLIEGRPAFSRRQAPSVSEAIELVHAAGGVAVWAHPFWDLTASTEVLAAIDRFRDQGLDGVECFYIPHTREQAELAADRCAELGMLTTGSSDFHGPEHPKFSRFRAFSTFGREPVLGPIAG